MKAVIIKNINQLRAMLQNQPKESKSLKQFDYSKQRSDYYNKSIEGLYEKLEKDIQALKANPVNAELINKIEMLYKLAKINENKDPLFDEMIVLVNQIKEDTLAIKVTMPSIPADIKDEINADINELNKAFSAGCFRASIILCGRILETCLHRKYYEVTGTDVLEKNPGIGLGTLVAKLKEKNVNLDPGVTQQIHLINQVRIFSVHKKQQAFTPTSQQAQAIILYTTDIVQRMF